MGIYRKNVQIQMVLFAAFLILGINVFLHYVLADIASWYAFIILGISILFIIWAVILYRKQDSKVIEITQQEVKSTRISLYAYFVVYVINIVLQGQVSINQLYLSIVSAILLSGIAIFGLLVHVRLLKRG